jgi:DNA-binding CsgD family transcriptional regulator
MPKDSQEALGPKLDTIIKLLAINVGESKKQVERIRLLSAAGLTPKAIADALGTTPNTVRVALSGMRKVKKKLGTQRQEAETDE